MSYSRGQVSKGQISGRRSDQTPQQRVEMASVVPELAEDWKSRSQVKVKVMGQANAASPTSTEGSFFSNNHSLVVVAPLPELDIN